MEALLRAVNATNDFENELAQRFGTAAPPEVGPNLRDDSLFLFEPLVRFATVCLGMFSLIRMNQVVEVQQAKQPLQLGTCMLPAEQPTSHAERRLACGLQ